MPSGVRLKARLGDRCPAEVHDRNFALDCILARILTDPVELMCCLSTQVTLAAMRATCNRNAFDDEQTPPFSIATRETTNPCPWLTTDITNNFLQFLSSHRQIP